MGMGFAPTWLRQVSPPLLHKITLTTDNAVSPVAKQNPSLLNISWQFKTAWALCRNANPRQFDSQKMLWMTSYYYGPTVIQSVIEISFHVFIWQNIIPCKNSSPLHSSIIFDLQITTARPACKNWTLVCWWRWFDWSFARPIAPVVQLSPPPPSSFASINTG